ncbi:hypothetical protein D9758_000278 [Tetrapyrgos nigripes]|uniref:TECPR1-like DysF domain-containing protein n=1 Tax=Tetrapyrgos nigripes TaxID=182062 RepID=A0A8H5H1W4_9AGAR|nr:hypothetical protein D9758_000278 [Tetrapyrgos nigripes]
MSTLALPPPSLAEDDVVDAARQRVAPKRKSRLSASLPNLKAAFHRSSKPRQAESLAEDEPPTTEYSTTSGPERAITFENVSSSADYDPFQDIYRWAVLYENQRGMTIFSIPLYSSSALLPADPAPFTLPSSSSQSRSHLPNVSIAEYPLPDGNWHWVSNSWMIDMRYSGEVQYDGFEYNWNFRKGHWRPDVGLLSAGGWVRRRRWIRLMMRPGLKRRHGPDEDTLTTPVSSSSRRNSLIADLFERRLSGAPSIPSVSTILESSEEILELGVGDVEEDWKMCRQLMKVIGRSDGGRLELWKRWLGLTKEDVKEKGKERDDDVQDMDAPEDPNTLFNCVKAVIDAHGPEILQLFVYPESKRRFIELLTEANIRLQDVDESLLRALQFRSLTSGLDLHACDHEKQ